MIDTAARFRTQSTIVLVCIAVSTGCVWLSGNRVDIYNVTQTPIEGALTIDEVGQRIRRAARIQGWEIEEVRPDVIYVTKRRSQSASAATASITYSASYFTIRFVSSDNLKETPDGRIHKIYNDWIRSLESVMRRELSSS